MKTERLINEPIIARIFKRTFIRTHNLGKDSWDEYKYIFIKNAYVKPYIQDLINDGLVEVLS